VIPQYFGSTLSELLPSIDSTTVGQMPRLTRLRELRLRAAMTQAELAEASGVARTTIIRLEAGDPNALPPTLRKLARALRLRRPSDLWEEPVP
jgi:DNA-binding XRE family transcriptional regulator